MLAVFPVAEHGEGGLVAAIERILVIAGRVDIALVEHLLHPFIRRDGVFAIHRAGRKHGVAVQVIAAEGSDDRHPSEVKGTGLVLTDVERILIADFLALSEDILKLFHRPRILVRGRDARADLFENALARPHGHAGVKLRHAVEAAVVGHLGPDGRKNVVLHILVDVVVQAGDHAQILEIRDLQAVDHDEVGGIADDRSRLQLVEQLILREELIIHLNVVMLRIEIIEHAGVNHRLSAIADPRGHGRSVRTGNRRQREDHDGRQKQRNGLFHLGFLL